MTSNLVRAEPRPLLARYQLTSLLEYICQAIEPTATEYADAEEKYRAVAEWLAGSDNPLLKHVYVYPQGSFALGTAVRPLAGGELDVDLILRLARLGPTVAPALVKAIIGARIREHGVYKAILEEKTRCWRLNYAGQFHLDMTGSILNPNCQNGGELVPDKLLGCWKATNPQGYRRWFDQKADMVPVFFAGKDLSEGIRAQIDALPAQVPLKGILRRIVQLLKRHRDKYFDGVTSDQAPISIIITTLAAQSYAAAVARSAYPTEFDLVQAVVAGLPNGLQAHHEQGKRVFFLPNPTTEGENFCEKWNHDLGLAEAFFTWHGAVVSDLARLVGVSGLDQTRKELAYAFGDGPVGSAFRAMNMAVGDSRLTGSLRVAPATGVVVAPAPGSVRPLRNTNFGRPA